MKISRRLTMAAAAVVSVGAAVAATPVAYSTAAIPQVCTERADGGSAVAYGLTLDQRVICFKVNRPSANKTLLSAGLLTAPDSALLGIDVRPSNGALYGLGDGGGIYLLDPLAGRPEMSRKF